MSVGLNEGRKEEDSPRACWTKSAVLANVITLSRIVVSFRWAREKKEREREGGSLWEQTLKTGAIRDGMEIL